MGNMEPMSCLLRCALCFIPEEGGKSLRMEQRVGVKWSTLGIKSQEVFMDMLGFQPIWKRGYMDVYVHTHRCMHRELWAGEGKPAMKRGGVSRAGH